MPSPRPRRFVALAALFCVALFASACGGGSGGSDTKHGAPGADGPTRGARANDRGTAGVIPLKAGPVSVESIGAPATLEPHIVKTIVQRVQQYVDGATVTPLLNGHRDSSLQRLFVFTIARRVAPSGPDRGALTDDAVGATDGRLAASSKPVAITALNDGAGHWLMVAATFEYSVRSTLDHKRLLIKRFGDLYFSSSPKHEWFITAYKVGVAREFGSNKKSSAARSQSKHPTRTSNR